MREPFLGVHNATKCGGRFLGKHCFGARQPFCCDAVTVPFRRSLAFSGFPSKQYFFAKTHEGSRSFRGMDLSRARKSKALIDDL
jgi:hypothetical protein